MVYAFNDDIICGEAQLVTEGTHILTILNECAHESGVDGVLTMLTEGTHVLTMLT